MSTVLDQLRAKTAQPERGTDAERGREEGETDKTEASLLNPERPLQRAWDTAQAGNLVQQRVSGLHRKDRRSVWSGLFTRYRITAKQRSGLGASLLKTFTTQYRRQIQTELEALGYPKRQIALTDPRVKQTLATLAGEHATLVQRTYNRLLESALAQLPPDASQHDVEQAIGNQINQARQYTSDVLVPYLQGRISDQAQRDFYTQNQIDVSWELDHPVSHQPPDETCQEARARSERGEADTSYRSQTPMPNHRYCQGRWRAKPAPGATLPPPEQLWDGDVTHALLVAKNQGLVCKVARRYPLAPVSQLQSRYQTLLLALDEIRRSPVVYSWLRDRVLLDLAAIQLEVTLQGYPEILWEQDTPEYVSLAVEQIDPGSGVPDDDPRNHQASQPVLMGDIIPGEALPGEVITKARIHAEQERLSFAWDPIKHPRDEHGHFATIDTHLDRMPERFRAKIDRRLDSLGVHQSDMEKHLYDLAMHALGTHNPARDTEFQKARDYFPSVHRFAEHLAGLHGVPLGSAAGVLAALSPRRKWKLPLDAKNLDNQAGAARLFDLVSQERAGLRVHVSPELARDFNRQALNTDPAGKAIASDITETGPMREGAYQLRDLSPMKAAHVAHALGYKLSAAAGHVPVARAIAIARTGDVETHLQGPKARSFYNNIVAPGQTGDVAVDTHVLRAALNEHAITVGGKEYGSARDWEKEKKTHTFQSLLFKIDGTKDGMGDHTGAYSVVRDAVARVGAEFGLTPDEMQSLVWRESQRKYLGVDPDTAHISARMMGRALTEYELHHDWERAQAHLYATDVPKSKTAALSSRGMVSKAGSPHEHRRGAWEEEKHPRGEHGHFTHVDRPELERVLNDRLAAHKAALATRLPSSSHERALHAVDEVLREAGRRGLILHHDADGAHLRPEREEDRVPYLQGQDEFALQQTLKVNAGGFMRLRPEEVYEKSPKTYDARSKVFAEIGRRDGQTADRPTMPHEEPNAVNAEEARRYRRTPESDGGRSLSHLSALELQDKAAIAAVLPYNRQRIEELHGELAHRGLYIAADGEVMPRERSRSVMLHEISESQLHSVIEEHHADLAHGRWGDTFTRRYALEKMSEAHTELARRYHETHPLPLHPASPDSERYHTQAKRVQTYETVPVDPGGRQEDRDVRQRQWEATGGDHWGLQWARQRENARLISEETGRRLSPEDALMLIETWGQTSHSLVGGALRQAAAEYFGVELDGQKATVDYFRQDPAWDTTKAKADDFIAAQYAITQRHYKDQGTTHVHLYRGIAFPAKGQRVHGKLAGQFTKITDAYKKITYHPENPDPKYPGLGAREHNIQHTPDLPIGAALEPWDHVRIPSPSLSAWANTRGEAESFADQLSGYGKGAHAKEWRAYGFVMSVAVPVERILSNPETGLGLAKHGEHLVIGSDILTAVSRTAYSAQD